MSYICRLGSIDVAPVNRTKDGAQIAVAHLKGLRPNVVAARLIALGKLFLPGDDAGKKTSRCQTKLLKTQRKRLLTHLQLLRPLPNIAARPLNRIIGPSRQDRA